MNSIVGVKSVRADGPKGPTNAMMMAINIDAPDAASELVGLVADRFKLERGTYPPDTSMLLISIVGDLTATAFAERWKEITAQDEIVRAFMSRMVVADAVQGDKSGMQLSEASLLTPEQLRAGAALIDPDRPTFQIEGTSYNRIKYGEEATDWGAARQPCGSCAVTAGEIHHAGCLIERCPKCLGQAVSCRCKYQEYFARKLISASRQRFYKAFYLTLLPLFVIGVFFCLVPVAIPLVFKIAMLIGIPLLITLRFWSKLGDIELGRAF